MNIIAESEQKSQKKPFFAMISTKLLEQKYAFFERLKEKSSTDDASISDGRAGRTDPGWSHPFPEHNRAAIMAYPQWLRSQENGMRLLLGLILGCALTIGGAYVADAVYASGTPMVNWDVVAKNVGAVTALAREGWKKITG